MKCLVETSRFPMSSPKISWRLDTFLDQENVIEEVPPQESSKPQKPPVPQMPPMPQGPQATYVEGDMTNVEIRADLRILTHLMMTQAHVVTNHVGAHANLGFGPQSNYSNLRMNKFVIGVSSLVEKEYCTTILLSNMDIYRLMVYDQQIEESNLREINRDGNRPRVDEPSQPNPKKRFYNEDPSMGNKDRTSELKVIPILVKACLTGPHDRPNDEASGARHTVSPGRREARQFRVRVSGVARGVLRGHKMRDFPNHKEKGNEVNQAHHDGLDPNAPKRNHFYELGAKEATDP
ncbi:hypothetical protein EJD97_025840 [Solanum chilense]|uniref:Uncharacterized protein n=1 Tax=Solanum chilense TaxID=4083 RepID=A0A6N2BZP6_SOLCI|nr:hypothetical protein EJD97_025840 [Solanum chilense]